jgi:hypothetical protein
MPNIFISHSWKYDQDYITLVSLLKERGYFSFKNYSIPEENQIEGNRQKVWDEITSSIQWSSIVILIAGVYASYSDSIVKEINIARRLGKPILAVKPYGNDYSSNLTDKADKTVNWNTESIVQAIRELTRG